MKRYLAIICATMLCVCCLVLAACGGGAASTAASSSAASASSSESAASASTTSNSASAASVSSASVESSSASASAASASVSASSASASAASADPTNKFVGTWKAAAIVFEGVTATGDFSTMFGEEADMTFNIQADGKGTGSFQGETGDFTWKQAGDDKITINFDGGSNTVEATLKDGVLSVQMQEDTEGMLLLTKDGKLEGAREISSAKAKDITSENALLGEWTLSGMAMSGLSMYGDAEALAKASGEVTETTVTFEQGGTAKVFGQDAKWTVGADGATVEMQGTAIPVKALDNDILLDVSSIIPGIDLVFVLSK